MRPSDLKSLREFLGSIRAELIALRTSFGKQLDSIHDAQERQRQEYERNRKVQAEIASAISDLRPTEDERRDNRSQSNRALAVQILLMLGTFGAFIAAAIYAGLAYQTYRDIHRQTKAAEDAAKAAKDAAYAACVGTQISREALLQSIQSGIDTHNSVVASTYQTIIATQAESAEIIPVMGEATVVPGRVMGVTVAVKNIGKSAAKNVHISIRPVFVPRDEDTEPAYPKSQTVLIITPRLNVEERPFVFMPVRDPDGNRRTTSANDAADLASGRKDLLTFVQITYNDSLGISHWLHFCRTFPAVSAEIGARAVHEKCINYNKADGNTVIPKPLLKPLKSETIPEINCTAPK